MFFYYTIGEPRKRTNAHHKPHIVTHSTKFTTSLATFSAKVFKYSSRKNIIHRRYKSYFSNRTTDINRDTVISIFG